MATDPTVPFKYLPAGPAGAPETQTNFDAFLKYIKERNDGTTPWDSFSMVGTIAGGNAVAGTVGETISSKFTATNVPTTTQWGDGTSIALTKGDWLISGFYDLLNNGATITAGNSGIGAVAGNDSTGLVNGDNAANVNVPAVAISSGSTSIPMWRANITSNTTYYLKINLTYTVATPQWRGRITAVRIR